MGILRKAEYKDKTTLELQNSLDKDLDEISGRITEISDKLDDVNGNISNFTFPETPNNANNVQILNLLDKDFSNLTAFPTLQQLEFQDYNFEAIDPIKLVFDKQVDLGQKSSVEIDLRDFYKHLSTQYNLVFATLQDMAKTINKLMDLIQANTFDALEEMLSDLADLKLSRGYIWTMLNLDFRAFANQNAYTRGGQEYLNKLDRSEFPAGFDFNSQSPWDINDYVKQDIPIFDKKALELYLQTIFTANINPIDISGLAETQENP